MENIQLPFRGKISNDVLFQEIEGEAVLLNLKNEQYFGLNEIGTRIWHLLAENGDSESVISGILKEYRIDEETLKQDVTALVTELAKKGLFNIES